MLQIKNLTMNHKKDLRPLLENFTFSLNPGDRAALIGEEGNGKSTLLKLIYDPTLVEPYLEWQGDIRCSGRFGMLFQEFPDKEGTVYDFFAGEGSTLEDFFDLDPREVQSTARSLGLPADICYSDQPVDSLSGGEKVKLQLCRVLLSKPDILLLDEPSNDLDLETLEWLEAFILRCPLPILYISHDETLLSRTANVILHIELVRRKTLPRCTIARMPYDQYMEERASKIAQQTKEARKAEEEYQQQQAKFLQIQSKVDHQLNAISRQNPSGGRLLKKKMHTVKSMGRRFEREHERAVQLPDLEEAIMLRFPEGCAVPAGKDVVRFELPELAVGGRVLAENIALQITGPERVCIIGKNGVGKTTLLRQIAESLLGRSDIRAAYMPQNYAELLPPEVTPVEFLAKSGRHDEISRVRTFLGSVKYTPEEMEHPAAEMSGGQRAKLLFLKMILGGCNVLVLDEPTRNFSPLSNPVIREVLRQFEGAIISISHDRRYISEVCTRVLRLTDKGLRSVDLPTQ